MSAHEVQESAWGSRLGFVIPGPNVVLEREATSFFGNSLVSCHFARASLVTETRRGIAAFLSAAERATLELLEAEVDVVVLACTTASLLQGGEGERALVRRLLALGAPAAISTAGALTSQLSELKVRRAALVAPYPEWLMQRTIRFFGEAGISIVSSAGLERSPVRQADFSRTELEHLASSGDSGDAEALILACTNLPTLAALPQLASTFRKPCISSNSATFSIVRQIAMEHAKREVQLARREEASTL